MINKILVSYLFVTLILAVSLALFGVQAPVTLAPSFMAFLRNCSLQLNEFKVEIPNIPMLDSISSANPVTINNPLDYLIYILRNFDWLRNFCNGVSTILNVIIGLINTLISLFQFIFVILQNALSMRDNIVEVTSSFSSAYAVIY